jgi:hypothetical protein
VAAMSEVTHGEICLFRMNSADRSFHHNPRKMHGIEVGIKMHNVFCLKKGTKKKGNNKKNATLFPSVVDRRFVDAPLVPSIVPDHAHLAPHSNMTAAVPSVTI